MQGNYKYYYELIVSLKYYHESYKIFLFKITHNFNKLYTAQISYAFKNKLINLMQQL